MANSILALVSAVGLLLLLSPLRCASRPQGLGGPFPARESRQAEASTTGAPTTSSTGAPPTSTPGTPPTLSPGALTTSSTAAPPTSSPGAVPTAASPSTLPTEATTSPSTSSTSGVGDAGYWGLLVNKPHGLLGHGKWSHLARPAHVAHVQQQRVELPAQHVIVTPVKWTHFVPQAALQATWLDAPAPTTPPTTTPSPPQRPQQDLLLVTGGHPLANRIHSKLKPTEGLLVGVPPMLRPAKPSPPAKPLTVTLVSLKKPGLAGLGIKTHIKDHRDGLHRSGGLTLPVEAADYADAFDGVYEAPAEEDQAFARTAPASSAEPCDGQHQGWWGPVPEQHWSLDPAQQWFISPAQPGPTHVHGHDFGDQLWRAVLGAPVEQSWQAGQVGQAGQWRTLLPF